MKDQDKTKTQLIGELVKLRRRNAKLETVKVEHKKAEEELRIKEAAISTSQNAIGITDLDAKLVYVNDSFLRLYGYDDESEVLGRSGADFWMPVEEAQKAIEELNGYSLDERNLTVNEARPKPVRRQGYPKSGRGGRRNSRW